MRTPIGFRWRLVVLVFLADSGNIEENGTFSAYLETFSSLLRVNIEFGSSEWILEGKNTIDSHDKTAAERMLSDELFIMLIFKL